LKRYFSLAGTKLLLFFLALGIIIFGYQYSFLNVGTSFKGYLIQNITASNIFFSPRVVDGPTTYILSGDGSVIGS